MHPGTQKSWHARDLCQALDGETARRRGGLDGEHGRSRRQARLVPRLGWAGSHLQWKINGYGDESISASVHLGTCADSQSDFHATV